MSAETLVLLPQTTIAGAVTAALSGPFAALLDRVCSLALYASFLYGAAGTTVKAWVQTSFDGGTTWMDIASFAFTTAAADRAYNLTATAVTAIATPGDGVLADNTSINGFLGGMFRVKYTTTGTYTGATSLMIVAMPK